MIYEVQHWEALFGFLSAQKSVVYLNEASPNLLLQSLVNNRPEELPFQFYWVTGMAQNWHKVWDSYLQAVNRGMILEYRVAGGIHYPSEKAKMKETFRRIATFGPFAVKVNDREDLESLAPFFDAAFIVYPPTIFYTSLSLTL